MMIVIMLPFLDGKRKRIIDFCLNALTIVKRNENESIDEFNSRFDKLANDIPNDFKPTPPTLLSYYLNAYQGQLSFFSNQEKPIDLVDVGKGQVC